MVSKLRLDKGVMDIYTTLNKKCSKVESMEYSIYSKEGNDQGKG